KRLVELDRGRIPVEHRPLQPTVAAGYADPRQFGQQRLAVAAPPELRAYVQVFQVDAVASGPRGEVEEPQGHAHDHRGTVLGGVLGDVREDRRVRAEQRGSEVLFGG